MPRPRASLATAASELPDTFTYAQARAAGIGKHELYRLRDDGLIEPLRRGLYRRSDAPLADLGLLAIATAAPRATLCLGTALVHHGLSDAIPAAPDVALPRGTRPPAGALAAWHHFATDTFDVGRGALALDPNTTIGLYSAERSIIDAFRTRATEGHELAIEALRGWLRHRGSQPSQLLTMAAQWPRTVTPLRAALQVLQ